jgi:predicted amidophosphoribosyltransferase
MTPSSAWLCRIRSSTKQWFTDRLRESVHCSECESAVTPWDSHCPNCGQESPARVSASVAVYMVLGFVFLAGILSFLVLNF